jgi:hypothetical protein
MLIEPKPRKEYEKPKPGLHLAVLADVVYRDNQPTAFGLKNQAKYVWVLEKKDSEGRNFQVRSKWLNRSTDPASDMYDVSTSVQNGTPIPPHFDPDTLLGKVNMLGIIHAPGVDKKTGQPVTWVNIQSINPAEETQKLAIPADFVRDRDKEGSQFGNRPTPQVQRVATASVPTSSPVVAASQTSSQTSSQVGDEDIPF